MNIFMRFLKMIWGVPATEPQVTTEGLVALPVAAGRGSCSLGCGGTHCARPGSCQYVS